MSKYLKKCLQNLSKKQTCAQYAMKKTSGWHMFPIIIKLFPVELISLVIEKLFSTKIF